MLKRPEYCRLQISAPGGILISKRDMELLGATREELREYCTRLGEPDYRGNQLARWIYARGVSDFDGMTDLPAEFRRKLNENATVSRSRVARTLSSPDGTRKVLLELLGGNTIESVLIPYSDRLTVCVSTQVGCAVGCAFCATGAQGFRRNLTAGEIVDQALTLQALEGRRVTNVVFMGMGEPLFNYQAVMRSVRLLNREIGVSMRRLTISTVGIVPQIRRLAAEKLQLTLAISLHAADDDLRAELIPISRKYPLSELIAACGDYAHQTGRRVTFEYMLLGEVNDDSDSAGKLAARLHGILCNVNVIPYNEVPGLGFRRPTKEAVREFTVVLEAAGIETTQRLERGHAIAAACGQLKSSGADDEQQ